jgi:hypothetical protein
VHLVSVGTVWTLVSVGTVWTGRTAFFPAGDHLDHSRRLTARVNVSNRLVETAQGEGVNAEFAYVDCAQDSTETQAVQTIASALNEDDSEGYRTTDIHEQVCRQEGADTLSFPI